MSNYIFSPNKWTVLEPELSIKNWSDLNLDSNLNMYIEFDILITTLYPAWRNIFHFTNDNNSISSNRVPAMWLSPYDTFFSVCNSTQESIGTYVPTPSIPFNTATHIVITLFNGSVNTYFNAVLQNTQILGGNLIEASSDTILYISDPWYNTDGGIKIKNLKFGNLQDSLRCNNNKFCVGFEPDNRAYCYGNDSGCLWNQNSCNNDNDCRTNFNITSPKYNGGGVEYCSPPLNTLSTSWPTGACPDIYQKLNQYSCNYIMNNSELQCYQNNYPDLKNLTLSQLQQNWSSKGCIQERNNQCPSYQDTSGLYNYIGCYNDMCYNGSNGPRALPNFRGLVNSIDNCASIADSNKETFFGVQSASSQVGSQTECWTGDNLQNATQYGLNVNRNKCGQLGGYCTQQLYQRDTPFPPPIPPEPVLTSANFANNIENFENKNEYILSNSNKFIIIFFIILGFVLLYIYCK